MDGTLIRNTDSVKYLCALNNSIEEHDKIQNQEESGSISWVEADYLKVKLIKGLELSVVRKAFNHKIRLITNLKKVLSFLKNNRILSVLITSGPIHIANIIGSEFGFDAVYGSKYGVKNDCFDGSITSHLDTERKLNCLKDFCIKNGICMDECIAIGDGESDTAIFRECRMSIALNYCETLKGKVSKYIITEDISDIIDLLEL